uniref:L domain-like protein n=1 Tax=Eucampia antarctica TaxID=49252 RepID=A0A7S2S786_9STRA|mmetsp:Transcript_3778/g.3550  ORF Transcript_3778/g.3550 Transcript_3778/m.3550 type:complete len:449 (+) Transcript_3778:262-1608(+)
MVTFKKKQPLHYLPGTKKISTAKNRMEHTNSRIPAHIDKGRGVSDCDESSVIGNNLEIGEYDYPEIQHSIHICNEDTPNSNNRIITENRSEAAVDQRRVGAVFVSGRSSALPNEPAPEENSSTDEDHDAVMAYVVDSNLFDSSNSTDSPEPVLIAKKISLFNIIQTSRWLKAIIIISIVIVVNSSIVSILMLLIGQSDSNNYSGRIGDERNQKEIRHRYYSAAARNISEARTLLNNYSPQAQALAWLTNEDQIEISLINLDRAKQRYIATLLYFSTGGPIYWNDQAGFLDKNNHECQWNGSLRSQTRRIECDCSFNTMITSLHLGHLNLTGTLPEELSHLPKIIEIDFAGNNHLQGMIPSKFGDLPLLRKLSLSDMDLSGTIPTELGELTNLESCQLYGNKRLSANFESLCLIDSLKILEVDCNNGTIIETCPRCKACCHSKSKSCCS